MTKVQTPTFVYLYIFILNTVSPGKIKELFVGHNWL